MIVSWLENEVRNGVVVTVPKKKRVRTLGEARELMRQIKSRVSLIGSGGVPGACSSPVMEV